MAMLKTLSDIRARTLRSLIPPPRLRLRWGPLAH
jgi:hypothetical protein